jgi:hypothetical protein
VEQERSLYRAVIDSLQVTFGGCAQGDNSTLENGAQARRLVPHEVAELEPGSFAQSKSVPRFKYVFNSTNIGARLGVPLCFGLLRLFIAFP